MGQKVSFVKYSHLSWRRICKLFLALSWQLGLLAGMLLTAELSPEVISLMRGALESPATIVGLLAVLFLPLLFSAFAVVINFPWLLLVICFFKAFSLGCCSMAVSLAFGSAGWLIRLLLLFSSVTTAPVLLWFWLRQISQPREFWWIDFLICCALVLLLGILDYRFIAPILLEIGF